MSGNGNGKIRIGILGASGYTGAELLRLLVRHPQAEIRLLTGERSEAIQERRNVAPLDCFVGIQIGLARFGHASVLNLGKPKLSASSQ